ncbi:MAG: hypothetical protein ACTSUF_00565 [Candidatus Heimdallarchaeaceae archaeon]
MKFLGHLFLVALLGICMFSSVPVFSASTFIISAEAGQYSSIDLAVDKTNRAIKVKIVPRAGSGFSFYVLDDSQFNDWLSGEEVVAYVGTKNITDTVVLEGRLGPHTSYKLILDNRFGAEYAEIELSFYKELPAPFVPFLVALIPLGLLIRKRRRQSVGKTGE